MTKNQTLQKVTDDYLQASVINSTADIIRIEEELLSKVHEAFDEHNVICAKDEKWKKPDSLAPGQIADILMRVFSIRSICCSQTADPDFDLLGIYISDDLVQWVNSKFKMDTKNIGIYDTTDRTFEQVIRRLNRYVTKREVDETMLAIKAAAPRVQRCLESNLIAVGNGIFNYKTKQLEPFSEDKVFLSKSPISYNPNAANVNIHNPDDGTDWDVESWIGDLSDDPDIVKLLCEILGAIIRPLNRWNKSAWFVSEKGNNGKGTLCELMRCLCGDNSYTSIPLSSFSQDFALEPLTRASAIIVDENDVGSFVDKAGNLKAVITNDVIQINRKFKTPITYQWYGFMVQCLNDYPRIKDKSDSFYRRQLFIPFSKCFTGIEREYIKKDYIHRTEVLEYVLKKVLESNYDKLSEPKSCMQALSEYKEINDPIRSFWADLHEEFVWNLLPFTFLYDLYKSWFKANSPSGTMIGKTTFTNDLLNVIKDDKDWYCDDKTKLIRVTKDNMDGPEPLIAQYHLEDWKTKTYKGNDINKICIPVLATSYRGILRVVQAVGTTEDTEENP